MLIEGPTTNQMPASSAMKAPVETDLRVAPSIIMRPPIMATTPGRMLSQNLFVAPCQAWSDPIEKSK